jgi:hypothetical protein
MSEPAKLFVHNRHKLVGCLRALEIDPLSMPSHFIHEGAAGPDDFFPRSAGQ